MKRRQKCLYVNPPTLVAVSALLSLHYSTGLVLPGGTGAADVPLLVGVQPPAGRGDSLCVAELRLGTKTVFLDA